MKSSSKHITALALFSGGLDSILAYRIIAAQGIQVRALKFVTPFFDHDLLDKEEQFHQRMLEKYRIEAELVDLSSGYIEMLQKPAHGFGKNFNPCIDCKIMMLRRARELMQEYGASFLISGEVLGQRPMSQRRDTLHLIERESGCRDILLRPLSAKLLNPTLAEQDGLIDREKLYSFAGRGRGPQLALAQELGIADFPAPAGGCVLTDPILSARIQRFYNGLFAIQAKDITIEDMKLLLVGRQFCLPGGHWLVLGRNEQENDALAKLRQAEDWQLFMPDHPGPLALLRRGEKITEAGRQKDLVSLAAALVVRYSKKTAGKALPGLVVLERKQQEEKLTQVNPLPDVLYQEWIV
jgi:tRNA-uridine 2-sulfurtransferase